MDLAVECVENGAEMSETLKAKYDTAGQNRDDQAARARDNHPAVAALSGAAPVVETVDLGELVVAKLEGSK